MHPAPPAATMRALGVLALLALVGCISPSTSESVGAHNGTDRATRVMARITNDSITFASER